MPWVPILSEMEALLRDMQKRATSYLLFPSRLEPEKPADASAIRRRLKAACIALDLGHVTPHGLRSYSVMVGHGTNMNQEISLSHFRATVGGPEPVASFGNGARAGAEARGIQTGGAGTGEALSQAQ